MTDWPAIVHQCGPLVWQTAYRLLGNDADAADCFQETFVSAMGIARRQSVANWPGLLQRVATTRALDVLRRRRREKARGADPTAWENLSSGLPGPDDLAQAGELARRLRQALSQLPPRQAEVFCLRSLSDLSYQQIAAELGLTVDAVGVELHRARVRLCQLLAELHPGQCGTRNGHGH